jgi:predicted RNase H-like nuclease (RuvC/YqgF family)
MTDNLEKDVAVQPEQADVNINEEFAKLKENYEKLQADFEGVLKNKNELLNEKKREAEARKQAEADKAKKEGDYESLIKAAEEERKAYEDKYNELNNKLIKKELRSQATKLANELNPLDADAADMLADYIEKRLQYKDDTMLILDANGNPSVMSSEQLLKEFKNSNKFKPLLKGSEATGGSALGATKTSGASLKEISMADYSKLDGMKKLEMSKAIAAGKVKLI